MFCEGVSFCGLSLFLILWQVVPVVFSLDQEVAKTRAILSLFPGWSQWWSWLFLWEPPGPIKTHDKIVTCFKKVGYQFGRLWDDECGFFVVVLSKYFKKKDL